MITNLRISLYRTSALLAAFTSTASAQLTWAPIDPTTDPWDLTSLSWSDESSPPLVTWDNTGAQQAIFNLDEPVTEVNIVDGGVVVGDLLYDPPVDTGILRFISVTDNLGLITIRPGGAMWNTSGAEIQLANNNSDTPLSIGTGDTLTLTGGGEFDTGERPVGANWTAAGATLDVTEATIVRGNNGSIGQFDTVRLPGDSVYIHERNMGEGYSNDWELGTGIIQFANRFNRNVSLSGVISGEGTLHAIDFAGTPLRLQNAGNTFSGGIIIDSLNNRTMLALDGAITTDSVLGTVPATFDPDNITLRNGGELLLNGITLDSNRGITLDGGVDEDRPGIIVLTNPTTYGGSITGTGGLQIGRSGSGSAPFTLTGNSHDYTGGTQIFRGNLALGADEVLPDDTVLTIGGDGTSRLILNGFTQTLTGLTTTANNTRQIVNFDPLVSPTAPTTQGIVILDIEDQPEVDTEFNFLSAFGVDETTDAGNLDIIKNGEGTIALQNVRVAGDVIINAGTLRIGQSNGFSVIGGMFTNNQSSLIIDEQTTVTTFVSLGDSDNTFNWEISDWTGDAGTGFTQFNILEPEAGLFSVDSSLNIVIEEANLANFIEEDTSFVVVTNLSPLDINQVTIDSTGFTAGTGTWTARSDGGNIILDYTAGAAPGPYTAFAASFPGLTGGFDDDDDSDGIANGLEYYFFNSDPTVANSSPSPFAVNSAAGAGNIVFTHDRPVDRSDLVETYEWSTTLEGAFIPSGVESDGITVTITPGAPTPAATGFETVTVTTSSSPATLETVFVRLSVDLR